jgi:hypothetical protein
VYYRSSNSRPYFRLPHGPRLELTNRDHVQLYRFFKIKLGALCDWYFSIIRPYLNSLLPENCIKSGSFIIDIL